MGSAHTLLPAALTALLNSAVVVIAFTRLLPSLPLRSRQDHNDKDELSEQFNGNACAQPHTAVASKRY